ncbi:DegT/DnrJ/EryC1/StrS family aminotransferase [Vibrio scophthalmi]|uniref:UDP-4-amino-4-deoxy-L-arabinose--oxoglutarate aminotransferase n=1 Tax=Vibrio scophthalmi TaxID=45658 RepID=A0A1E3WJI2_9VIBR|nr:DegT/DnrJ/EryC1/StrS family aminotransferase [Vibrio scophthalmi]ODS09939.1 UDP-4-amino-4-deoxy-L-arabinose--oxoglutarate aminotransferase [Vibrio scophthalmi]
MIKLSQPQIPESAISRVGDILRSGQLIHGEECIAFENELAKYLDVKHALVVSNGTAALHLALLSLNIGQGDAVIVPDFTFAATANIVEITGAKAVIVDVEETSYNLDPVKLEECILNWNGPEKLKAIMPVLEFGNPTNLIRYREIADKYNLAMIEDAACALGARDGSKMVGTVGDFGCFSFHPRKTLTTGEGGALVTNNTELYQKAALLRNHGMERSENGIEFKCIGLNYRLTNFQAAIGRSILPSLNGWIDCRRQLAELYINHLNELEKLGIIKLPRFCSGHSLQSFMIILHPSFERNFIINSLRKDGIETNLGAQSMTALDLFTNPENHILNSYHGNNLYKHGLVLPLHEGLNKQDIEFVCSKLIKLTKELYNV